MTRHTRPGQVTAIRLTAARAEQRIRETAADTSKIVWSEHIHIRMAERSIDDVDVLRILQRGCVDEEPVQAREGEWKAKMKLRLRGTRTAAVVTIIMVNGNLFLKTVEWEDGM